MRPLPSTSLLPTDLTFTRCSDDEYRLLRANLFERFTNVSTVPSEAPIVRLSVSTHQSSSSSLCPRSCVIRLLTLGDHRLAYTLPLPAQFAAGLRSIQGVNSLHIFWNVTESNKSAIQLITRITTSHVLGFYDTPHHTILCTKQNLPTTFLTKTGERRFHAFGNVHPADDRLPARWNTQFP